jgi:serine/threonine protein phosphatase PrpC
MSWIDGFDPRHLRKLIHPWDSAGPRKGHSDERIYSSQNTFTTVATAPMAPQSTPIQARRRHLDQDKPLTLEFAKGAKRRIFDATTEQETRHATLPLRTGDRLLLMSDGLYGEVSEAEMAQLLEEHPDPERAASALLTASMKALAMDNITAVVVHFTESGNNFDP